MTLCTGGLKVKTWSARTLSLHSLNKNKGEPALLLVYRAAKAKLIYKKERSVECLVRNVRSTIKKAVILIWNYKHNFTCLFIDTSAEDVLRSNLSQKRTISCDRTRDCFMSAYGKLLSRLGILAILAMSTMLMAKPAAATTCAQQCRANYSACLDNCPPREIGCGIFCSTALRSCLTACN